MRALQLDFAESPPLTLREVEPPQGVGEERVRLRPRLSGICGTDVTLLSLKASFWLAPLVDLPATLGHEIVAHDEDGRRVVVDMVLGCEARGLELCPSCAAWQPQLCNRVDDGIGLVGLSDVTGGGWSEELVVPRWNVFEVPDAIPDERAVLLESATVMVHAALQGPIRSPVLVVGAGVVGLLGIAVIRALAPEVEIVALAKHEQQAAAAEAAGARAVRLRSDAHHFEELAALSGARLSGPSDEQPTVTGGFPTVFECVGNGTAMDLAIRMADTRGTVIVVGGSSQPEGLDLSPIWGKETRILGSFCYGYEDWEGERVRTFEVTLDLLRTGRLQLGDWTTHVFALEEYPQALEAAMGKASGALKVAFRP